MSAGIFYGILFMSPALLGSFYLSEIFANMPGRLSNKGSAWIELANIAPQSLIIEHLRLQIFDAESRLHLDQQLEVPKLHFEDRLVLAEKRELMPGLCLNKRVVFIELSPFNIPKGRQKICVTINRILHNCAMLSAQDRFKDGVSLYRSHEGSFVQPLWRSEPCHIGEGVFATPGLVEQACLEEEHFFSETLSPCSELSAPIFPRKSKLLVAKESNAPTLTLLNDSLFRVEDPDPSDLLVLASCSRPQGSKLLCHEMCQSRTITKAQDQPIQAMFPAEPDTQLFLKVRDLSGLESSVEASHKPMPALSKLSLLKAEHSWLNAHEIHILFSLEKEHVPLNYWLKNAEGDVLKAGAFLSSGQKTLALANTKKPEVLSLVVKTLHEEHTISLNDEAQDGCSTSSIRPWWIVFAMALVWVFKEKNRYSSQ